MSQYDRLDSMILKRIETSANGVCYTEMISGIVGQESYRVARLTYRETGDVLKGRLQMLRRLGKIKHDRQSGWQLCAS